ncbi:hypothetical protein [Micromonospora sp. HUAS LYJ1]|uniref:hypothetical protein n=1 Tax=unclassified Micromonospora TaxID=2617518 RepID=UPI002673BEF6|nr:hypothetical protein [Micromonospora sp. HUAS LYJ1]WKU03438.1 hypothetical protein Q2K16_21630 [Micromonospora sp. HUAS LYJ1]
MDTPSVRGLWIAYVLLLSMIIGLVGGALAYLGGDNPAKAIIAGGASFAATVGLAILTLTFLAGTRGSVPVRSPQVNAAKSGKRARPAR